MANESPLPSVMQRRMAELQGQSTPPSNDPPSNDPPSNDPPSNDPPSNDPPSNDPPPSNEPPNDPPANGERITLSRDEYNALRAQSGKAEAAEGRAEAAQMKLDELSARLTELEASHKGTPSAPAPSAPAPAPAPIDVSGITFTDEENEQFGESREWVEKLVKVGVANELNRLLPSINAAIEEVKKAAGTAVTNVEKNAQRTFHQQVLAAVPNLQELIKHKHWADFLDETESFSGYTFDQLLAHHINKQNLDRVQKIYKAFEEKYIKPAASNAGYNGAAPDGNATQLPPDPATPKKLKMSDRRKASDDYKFKRNGMTWEKLQEITKAFEEAEKNGNIEYD